MQGLFIGMAHISSLDQIPPCSFLGEGPPCLGVQETPCTSEGAALATWRDFPCGLSTFPFLWPLCAALFIPPHTPTGGDDLQVGTVPTRLVSN